jgi:hypothetical protein
MLSIDWFWCGVYVVFLGDHPSVAVCRLFVFFVILCFVPATIKVSFSFVFS